MGSIYNIQSKQFRLVYHWKTLVFLCTLHRVCVCLHLHFGPIKAHGLSTPNIFHIHVSKYTSSIVFVITYWFIKRILLHSYSTLLLLFIIIYMGRKYYVRERHLFFVTFDQFTVLFLFLGSSCTTRMTNDADAASVQSLTNSIFKFKIRIK